MRLDECEVAHRHMRGHNAIFIFGPRALSADEAAALGAEYTASYGAGHRPAYCSPGGWQLLYPAPVIASHPVADEQAMPAAPAAVDEATKRPRAKK